MSYWACASLEQNRVELGLHFLKLNSYTTYCPRIRTERHGVMNGTALLFPGYCFLSIELQWHRAARSPGVAKLIMDGEHPAKVPERIIADLRAREGDDGLIALPSRPAFVRGDRVRIIRGVLQGQIAIFQDMKPKERIEVLLSILGAERQLELARRDVLRVK